MTTYLAGDSAATPQPAGSRPAGTGTGTGAGPGTPAAPAPRASGPRDAVARPEAGAEAEERSPFATIEAAIAEIAAGRPVVVVDDEDRENEGDLIFAAEAATPELLAFMIRHTAGVVCVPLDPAEVDRLELDQMVPQNTDRMRTAFTVSVDARTGVSTGISAADRARTIRLLADPATSPGDLTRPGHIFPLRAREGGVLRRPGHTEAAVDLARLAGLRPAGTICEIVNDDGTMARLPELVVFAREHNLALISIADLITYRRRTEMQVERMA
ncbi:3,4-dihydroxy-2-butanone-4-phosphate synthase, partial [Frankia sp. EI5c]|uniref:3,4-dihydroxy-2-butanone-4-phosphate synthase n=1 Tax=Frankia sp. EI5c TaxID=683316 RepID=UPI001F5BD371